jgi:hypothetical protein
MAASGTGFDPQFLRDLREILRSDSTTEFYDAGGGVAATADMPFLEQWRLRSLDFDPVLGKKRVVAILSAAGKTVTATIDAADFPDLARKKSRSRAWNSTRYRDLAVLVSVLIQEQVVTWEPAELEADQVRIRRPADRDRG